MKEFITTLILKYLNKSQIIGFVAGVAFSLLAGALGMSAAEVKNSICSAPVVQLPVK